LTVLIRILAETDALFRPLRDPRSPNWRTVCGMRVCYASAGLPWHVGGADAERKAGQRELDELRAARLAVTTATADRTSHVKLTARGDAVARRLADLPGLPEAVDTCRLMDSLRNDDDSAAPGSTDDHADDRPYLAETCFADGRRGWNPGESNFLPPVMDQMALPAVLGWVQSNGDAGRHVRFRLTPRGLSVARGEHVPRSFRGLPSWERWAFDAYENAFDSALKDLRGKDDGSFDIGMISLPCSFLTKGAARLLAAGKRE
jgi:hypothetical protein